MQQLYLEKGINFIIELIQKPKIVSLNPIWIIDQVLDRESNSKNLMIGE